MAETKTIKFVGGPLDGKTREVPVDVTVFEDDQPAPPEDLQAGDIPIGFFPPFHRYVYEESPEDSGIFVCTFHQH